MPQPPSVFALCGAVLTSVVGIGALGAIASTRIFLPAVTYDSGGNGPNSVAVADLNGDGKPDLVVSHYTSVAGYPNGAVGVLLGNGDATFQPVMTYDSGGVYADSVAAADVNGDDTPDLLVGNSYAGPAYGQGDGTVGVLVGNGDGTFQSAVSYNSGGALPAVAAADVNGDAKIDVLVANWVGNSLGVLLGNGDGTFRQVVTYDSGGKVPTWVTVADANGDGKPDLLVANWWTSYQNLHSGAVGVLVGNGDGTFQPAVLYGSGGYGAASVASADINSDGNQDLVVANCDARGTATCTSRGIGNGVVGVLFGNGDGTFHAAVSYDLSGLGAGSVAIADVNGDARLDVLVASCGSSSCSSAAGVLLGNGDGTFQAAVRYGSGGDGAASVAVADLNGDMRPDLLVATCATGSCSSGSVGVLVNNTAALDTTAPVLTLSVTPKMLWPPNARMVPVRISGSVTDTGSGVNVNSATYAVKDEYGQIHPKGAITLTPQGSYSFIVMLKASRLGTDKNGRRYDVIVHANDNAGNSRSKSTVVIVPHHRNDGP